jgi:hypothetical protein
LPLLRGVILNQEKSATYKLALLRCIARIADTSPNVARDAEDHVDLPLGLIALYWIRMFKPLIERGLPQRPGDRMGFVTEAFRALGPLAAYDLRPGAVFRDVYAEAMRRALGDASRLIAMMPATHLTFADNRPVFPTCYGRMPSRGPTLSIDEQLLWEFGTTRVPHSVWHALRRMSAWIEPMLVAEWVRLTQGYGERMSRIITVDEVTAALRWIEPQRDTGFVRGIAKSLLDRGEQLTCVWSGQQLGTRSIDIDHCLPWSAWACSDLWNLMPTAPMVNRHRKAERIVTSAALAEAKPRIVQWWQAAYINDDPALRLRFSQEAQTTLPIQKAVEPDLEDIFTALDFRRLRLRQDTQVPEWSGIV